MICPYCYEECGALFIHPELGLICPRCRDKEISDAADDDGASGNLTDCEYGMGLEDPLDDLSEEELKLIEYMKNHD